MKRIYLILAVLGLINSALAMHEDRGESSGAPKLLGSIVPITTVDGQDLDIYEGLFYRIKNPQTGSFMYETKDHVIRGNRDYCAESLFEFVPDAVIRDYYRIKNKVSGRVLTFATFNHAQEPYPNVISTEIVDGDPQQLFGLLFIDGSYHIKNKANDQILNMYPHLGICGLYKWENESQYTHHRRFHFELSPSTFIERIEGYEIKIYRQAQEMLQLKRMASSKGAQVEEMQCQQEKTRGLIEAERMKSETLERKITALEQQLTIAYATMVREGQEYRKLIEQLITQTRSNRTPVRQRPDSSREEVSYPTEVIPSSSRGQTLEGRRAQSPGRRVNFDKSTR